ncbi:sialate O-acetylesterase [Clostridium sardiniense]|uniref:Sialate O-acetylesterase n=1 Tax=Clostridium sardiniense TaxID=29369 RepID=A0ABS7L3F0_CLOSR|nr:sialate O-acetylesterase [Clostridium sardiniense]MBY0757262.1 sialate O-acetylesterase [Clostridium sardiniense]MDQ0461584.1 hypothetical protein [Clostridium sardiniense]
MSINKEKIDVFLLIGQSNAIGCGNVEDSILPRGAFEYLDTDDIIPMRKFLELSRGNGTIAQSFSKSWKEDTGKKLCFIQSAVDGSMIKNWGHDRYNYLDDAIYKYENAVSKLDKIYEVDKAYAIWIQGESDGKYGTDPIYYKNALIDLGDKLNKIGIEKTFVSQTGYWDGTNPLRMEVIMVAQEEACRESSNLILCSKKGPTFKERKMLIDEVHYNQNALNELGRDIEKSIYNYCKEEKSIEIPDEINLNKAKEIYFKLKEIINY